MNLFLEAVGLALAILAGYLIDKTPVAVHLAIAIIAGALVGTAIARAERKSSEKNK